MQEWARGEMRRHNVRMVAEAGAAIATFDSKDWIGEVDVPTTIFLTLDDNAVLPLAQLELADAIPGSAVHRFEGGHVACVDPDFGVAITTAVRHVATRAGVPVVMTR
jgi:3-oxoadipate enol-lactonase